MTDGEHLINAQVSKPRIHWLRITHFTCCISASALAKMSLFLIHLKCLNIFSCLGKQLLISQTNTNQPLLKISSQKYIRVQGRTEKDLFYLNKVWSILFEVCLMFLEESFVLFLRYFLHITETEIFQTITNQQTQNLPYFYSSNYAFPHHNV